jgi:hypothetical protein
MLGARDGLIAAAIKAGSLVRYGVTLEEGQLYQRQLWLRPEIRELLGSGKLDRMQRLVVQAALRRFVVGGSFTIVTKECTHREVLAIGDIRELKGYSPPFLELRFKPPKYDLRLFGRCIGKDRLILMGYGMKSLTEPTKQKPLSVREQCKRCDDFFKMCRFEQAWIPLRVHDSFSNAEFA